LKAHFQHKLVMPPQEKKNRQHDVEESTGYPRDGEDPLTSRSHPTMEQLDPFEPVSRPSVYRRESFLVQFATSKGPRAIASLMLLLALGLGSTVGVVPAVVTDRYARLHHGYSGDMSCSDYSMTEKPQSCLDGSADAQQASALGSLVSNVLTFLTSSLMGSISDEHGRRGKCFDLIACLGKELGAFTSPATF
jgi:hypothetical protein